MQASRTLKTISAQAVRFSRICRLPRLILRGRRGWKVEDMIFRMEFDPCNDGESLLPAAIGNPFAARGENIEMA